MLFSRLWIGQWAPRHGGDSRIRSRRHAGSRQGRDGSHLRTSDRGSGLRGLRHFGAGRDLDVTAPD